MTRRREKSVAAGRPPYRNPPPPRSRVHATPKAPQPGSVEVERLLRPIREHYEREGDDTALWTIANGTPLEVVEMVMTDLRNAHILADTAGEDAERAISRAKKAESDLESARSPNEEQMRRLNETVVRLNAENAALRAAHQAPPCRFMQCVRVGAGGCACEAAGTAPPVPHCHTCCCFGPPQVAEAPQQDTQAAEQGEKK